MIIISFLLTQSPFFFLMNVYQIGTHLLSLQYKALKSTIMEVVSSRDFRSQMGEYMRKAKNSDIVIKSRNFGSFKLVPISEDDTLISKEEFFARIDEAIQNFKEGRCYTMNPGETLDEFMARMEAEGNV